MRIDQVIQSSAEALLESQSPIGAWMECFDTGTMSDAQTAISLYFLNIKDEVWIEGLLHRIKSGLRESGYWGLYSDDDGDLSTTVECYYALQLYNRWVEHPEIQQQVEQNIIRSGGLQKCRNLTKMFLAVGGEIPWFWLPTPWLYKFLFSTISPIRIHHIVTFTRLHIAPMILLSATKARLHDDHVLGHLMTRSTISITRLINKWVSRLPSKFVVPQKYIQQCQKFIQDHVENDGSLGGYHSSTFLYLFTFYKNGDREGRDKIAKIISGIRANYHVDPSGEIQHQQTCNAHIWNTALATNSLLQTGLFSPAHWAIQRAVHFLVTKQQMIHSHLDYAGWGFSSNNTKHPDVDDTIACLEAISYFKKKYALEWHRGVRWVVHMQNRDGGWSAFENNKGAALLEYIPANDMKNAMSDPSTPDMTGRVVQFLTKHHIMSVDDIAIVKAKKWLIHHQRKDGSWFGRWGSAFLYGTWCAVKGLASIEKANHPTLCRAKEWLLAIQHADGGFGESCKSDVESRYVPHPRGQPTQTAWGLDTLLTLYDVEAVPVERARLKVACDAAVNWLVDHFHNGKWRDLDPTGTAFPGALYIKYHLYPKIWPLVALSHYQDSIRDSDMALKGGECRGLFRSCSPSFLSPSHR